MKMNLIINISFDLYVINIIKNFKKNIFIAKMKRKSSKNDCYFSKNITKYEACTIFHKNIVRWSLKANNRGINRNNDVKSFA